MTAKRVLYVEDNAFNRKIVRDLEEVDDEV